jgi:hypothetical protein
MRTFSGPRGVVVTGTLALAAGVLAVAPAQAAAPTQVRDHVTSVRCTAVNGPTITRFLVADSDLAGTEAVAQVAEDGVVLSEGRGTSDWTATTFRAAVVLEERDGGGHLDVTGDAFLSGTYAATGSPVREVNRFKDGNIRVVEDHTTTALAVSDVVLTINGEAVGDVTCAGDTVDGSLFVTAPASYVLRGGFLFDASCTTQNMVALGLFGSMDALSLSFGYADTADSSAASGDLDLTAGTFTGEFNYHDGVGPAGTVPATVSAVRSGRVIRRVVDRSEFASERWVMTPYLVSIAAEGREGADASATCRLYDIDATLHLKTGKLDG